MTRIVPGMTGGWEVATPITKRVGFNQNGHNKRPPGHLSVHMGVPGGMLFVSCRFNPPISN